MGKSTWRFMDTASEILSEVSREGVSQLLRSSATLDFSGAPTCPTMPPHRPVIAQSLRADRTAVLLGSGSGHQKTVIGEILRGLVDV
jgi:hypothetical protein